MSKPFRMHRLSKTRKKAAKRAAKSLTGVYEHVAFSYADNKANRKEKGRFGPASEGRVLTRDEVDAIRSQYEK